MNSYNSKEVGMRIMALRKSKNLTLAEIGMSIGESKQTIFKYERGVIENIPYKNIEKLANYHNVSPSYIVGWNEAEMSTTIGGKLMNKKYACRMDKVFEALKTFNDMVNADVKTVTSCDSEGVPIPETCRPATDKDRLMVILDSWSQASQEIYELGIDLDEPVEVTL